MRVICFVLFFAVFSGAGIALSLTDFVPGFLLPEDHAESDAANLPIKPLVDPKRNASSGEKTWYCTRMQNGVSNVFCNKNTDVTKVITYGNNVKQDKPNVIDNAAASNNDINQNMAARTTSFQDQKVTNLLQKQQDQIQNNASIPLQPAKDVKMNINAQQVQFNIQY